MAIEVLGYRHGVRIGGLDVSQCDIEKAKRSR